MEPIPSAEANNCSFALAVARIFEKHISVLSTLILDTFSLSFSISVSTADRCGGWGIRKAVWGSTIFLSSFSIYWQYHYLLIVQIKRFGPSTSNSTTESYSFGFSAKIFSWSALAGGAEPRLGRPECVKPSFNTHKKAQLEVHTFWFLPFQTALSVVNRMVASIPRIYAYL